MATFCLTKKTVEEFKKALKTGALNPFEMAQMTSEQRRAVLQKYVGEHAKDVNALFESKLLLKNQKAGYQSWVKKVAGISPQVKQDLLSKIERMDRVLNPIEEKQFLQDLASARLKLEITLDEAKTINDLSNKITETREKANADGTFPSEEAKFSYGAAKVSMEKYINDLKLQSRSISAKQQPVRKLKAVITEAPGVMKSIVASLDNSFFGRQGIKTLYTNPAIWSKAFIKSWGDIAKELAGKDAVDVIRADIYSRPNALNGKYDAGGYGLSVLSEEAFPSSLPERIPLLGRLFKASQSAYNGAALRIRADLADKYIAIAEKQGVNTLDKVQAQGIGSLVSSLTGRGNIGKLESISKEVNVILFSVKFLKSNIDILTAHQFDSKATPFVKKQAAKNIFRIIATIASVLTVANLIDPESVEEDPRSPNFGKIKIFGHWTDITGGAGSLVTLATRLVPTKHDGKWSFWKKSGSGEYTDLLAGKYGQQTALDIAESFIQGKLSPFAGVVRDAWKGTDYQGKKVTPTSSLLKVLTPISVQNYKELINDPNSSSVLGSMILDGLGLSVSLTPQPNIETGIIPENKAIPEREFMFQVEMYAKAYNTDPETAWNKMFKGQRIEKVEGGKIKVLRNDMEVSEAEKARAGKKNKEWKLDHTVPLALAGDELPSNRKLVSTSLHGSYTSTENALIRAVENKKLSIKDAQKFIIKFKKIESKKERDAYGEKLRQKYK